VNFHLGRHFGVGYVGRFLGRDWWRVRLADCECGGFTHCLGWGCD